MEEEQEAGRENPINADATNTHAQTCKYDIHLKENRKHTEEEKESCKKILSTLRYVFPWENSICEGTVCICVCVCVYVCVWGWGKVTHAAAPKPLDKKLKKQQDIQLVQICDAGQNLTFNQSNLLIYVN